MEYFLYFDHQGYLENDQSKHLGYHDLRRMQNRILGLIYQLYHLVLLIFH